MNERGNQGNDNNIPRKQPQLPNKYKEALKAQLVDQAQLKLESEYDAQSAETLATDMYEEMRIYFHDYDLSIVMKKVGDKTIPVINAGSFEIARFGTDDYRYTDNLGQQANEASIARIVEMMGDNPDIDQEKIDQMLIDDAEIMAKIVLLFDIPEQIEILPPADMYRHTQDIEDNELIDYNYDLDDDDSQDGQVTYIDANGKKYNISGPHLEHINSTDQTPSSDLSLKTIMVPGKGIIMYNVSKKYFELTTFEHKTIRATSIENLKREFDKLK